jgi:uncharacterized protein (TIGR03437 family)
VRAAVLLLLIAGASTAQVQSAADVSAGVYATVLAQGSLAVINFSEPASIPATSATVSLLPVNSTTPIPAQVTNVQPFTITFVVPANTPTGAVQLIYKPGNQATRWTSVTIVPANLALVRTGTTGPLIAENINPDGTVASNGLTTPAQPGQPVVLVGTGLGSTPQSAVAITLGGVAQTVLYAGAAPGLPGVNQINFHIAPGTPDGCYVPLTVTYGTQSVTSFLSKTSDGLPCHHPFQLSVAALQLLDGGSSIETGVITMTTGIEAASSDRASRQESAQVQYLYLNAPQIANYFVGTASTPAQSACTIVNASGTGGSFVSGIYDPGSLGVVTLADAASTLTPPWASPPPADSPLNDLPPPVIAAGPWTFSTSGGSALAASSFGFVLPPPIQIAGGAPLTLNRSQSQTIAWSGSGYDSNATLQLSLTAQYPGSPVLTCSVPAQSGGITLPSNLLSQFSSGSAGAVSVLVGENAPGIPYANFSSNGSPLLMLVIWSSTDARPVDFQ